MVVVRPALQYRRRRHHRRHRRCFDPAAVQEAKAVALQAWQSRRDRHPSPPLGVLEEEAL